VTTASFTLWKGLESERRSSLIDQTGNPERRASSQRFWGNHRTPVTGHTKFRHAIWVPFNAELQQRFAQRFCTGGSVEIYGQTECVPITYTPLGATKHNRASCGHP
jgi:hypothetical protein